MPILFFVRSRSLTRITSHRCSNTWKITPPSSARSPVGYVPSRSSHPKPRPTLPTHSYSYTFSATNPCRIISRRKTDGWHRCSFLVELCQVMICSWVAWYFSPFLLILNRRSAQLYFQSDVTLLRSWYLPGTHYSRTLEDWLNLQDKNTRQGLRELEEDAISKGKGRDEGCKTFHR